jgi:hypothetical protein
MDVAQDLMVQMPDRSSQVLSAMELEQYFNADECVEVNSKLVNGHHINIHLKDTFIEDCNYNHTLVSTLDVLEL